MSYVIRERRETLGLSQTAVANAIGVSKSFLSHMEAGKRSPSDDQLEKLANILQLPTDMLSLAAGRVPGDVEAALQADPASVVAAVRRQIEEAALQFKHAPSRHLLPISKPSPDQQASIPERIEVTKSSASYRAHSYHTKVPPEAIQPFIEAFTRPSETILDPFCGSGMTGVAALKSGRNAVLSDLSPAAVHIATNYTTPCDPTKFAAAVEAVRLAVSETMQWLYKPAGSDEIVEYTTWSDVFRCPACNAEITYWSLLTHANATPDAVSCPHCDTSHRKADLEWIDEVPVQSHTSRGRNRIHSHPPTAAELRLIDSAEWAPIPYWVPDVPFDSTREMWRASHRAMGIKSVSQFFTRRNLHALGALRHAILMHSQGRIRQALMFAFTAAVNRASRRYQWNAKRPTNVMTGTLYISSLRYEWNVWSLFRRKAADVLRYYQSFPKTSASAEVFQRSAHDLSCIPDASVDFAFMDPPFGSNIFYADASLLWDAWLGTMTDQAAEIVINKHRSASSGGKTITDYGDLMQQSFVEIARVLKASGTAVLAFSNSDDAVWQCVQSSLTGAGFDTEAVHILSKGQPSIKGVKGRSGKENVTTYDLLLRLKHRTFSQTKRVAAELPANIIDRVIEEALTGEPRATDEIYSAVVRAALAGDYSVAGITMPSIAARCANIGTKAADGKWTRKPAPDQCDYVAGYLRRDGPLPVTTSITSPKSALTHRSVAGGRNGVFYLAHSYHTKVPPEAIIPFIEHYTKPGDIVLDPFCGSGMTGIAAALSGRRSILNDLSPTAIHLAWNHTRNCNPEELSNAFAEIRDRLTPAFNEMYRTADTNGGTGTINWTMWSTEHRCPVCNRNFLLWDAIDKESGRLGRTISCPRCSSTVNRSELHTTRSVPAWISYIGRDGRLCEKAASSHDVKKAISFTRDQISDWFPDVPLQHDREMHIRCALHLYGVQTVADLYTNRNLRALAMLWAEIQRYPDDRVKRALSFAFTNTAWHGTRMRRFNARGGQRPLTGTLYIPQLSSEANVLEVMHNKIRQLQKFYTACNWPHSMESHIFLGSASTLTRVEANSVDYVFTDPPFGSNIFYSDCNLLWDSWLGRVTDSGEEAVVNRSLKKERGGKTLADYSALMVASMREIARVLKPSGWATVVFHNTDSQVWQVLRDAAREAGFEFHEATSLDRKQQSHKGYKGRSEKEDVAHFDVVFNLRKMPQKIKPSHRISDAVDLTALVSKIAKDPLIAKRGLQGIHAEVMRRLASDDRGSFVSYSDVREVWQSLSQDSG